jgi:hypothetical protein
VEPENLSRLLTMARQRVKSLILRKPCLQINDTSSFICKFYILGERFICSLVPQSILEREILIHLWYLRWDLLSLGYFVIVLEAGLLLFFIGNFYVFLSRKCFVVECLKKRVEQRQLSSKGITHLQIYMFFKNDPFYHQSHRHLWATQKKTGTCRQNIITL